MKKQLMRICLTALVLLGLTTGLVGGPGARDVRAASYGVTTTADSGAGSLRQAILDANANAGADTITFDRTEMGCPSSACTITLASTLPAIDDTLTITGPGAANLTISGNNAYRVMVVNSGKSLTLSGVTIANGRTPGGFEFGGGIHNAGTLMVSDSTFSGNSGDAGGGGIHNAGTMTVSNSTFSGNSSDYGGGILNLDGTLTVTNSTFSGNTASFDGGAIENFSSSSAATLTVTNSTFSANSAGNWGGGIDNDGGATLTVRNSTFSGNGASASGGGVHNNDGVLHLLNNILANSTTGGDCRNLSTISTDLNNLVEDGGCSTGAPSRLSGDPNLGALADNGGPTQTFGLITGSAALGAGDSGTCAASPVSGLDQRGVSRPQLSGCDIGAYEASLVVTNTSDTGPGSLREVILLANANSGSDTITFDRTAMGCAETPCTITLGGSLPPIEDDLAITGPGAANLTISGNNSFRIVNVNSEKSLTLFGVTVTGGKDAFGGGIYNAGTLTVTNSTFSLNDADFGGGSIYNEAGGTVTVSNSTFSNNEANVLGGGGIYNDGGTLTVANSTFSGNDAGSNGGGIYNTGTLTVANSTFSGNSADGGGGGGGGITNYYGTLTVSNSTFSGNSAAVAAGIANYYGTLTVSNSTFSGNSAAVAAGGIYNGGTLHLRNTIVANSTSGGDCANGSTIATDLNNLVEDGSCSTGASSRLSGDPTLGPLADNGGPTQTFALLAGSPAIDAGDSVTCAASPVSDLDQRGVDRPLGAACDIGAFEAGALSLVVTTTDDDGEGSLRAAITLANKNPGADTITFDRTAMGCPSSACTITLSSQLPAIDDDVTITGPGAANLTISGDDAYRVMKVNLGKSLTLSAVTIADGRAVSNNGGGIFSMGSVTVSDSTFSGNATTGNTGGGAIWVDFGSLTVSNSTFSGNSAAKGGAIAVSQLLATATVSNSTFSGNSATADGGGIYNIFGTVGVFNSTFSGNTASNGGGIFSSRTLTVKNSTLSGNGASTSGGGIRDSGTLTLENTIIANSTSGGDCSKPGGPTSRNVNNLIEDGSCNSGTVFSGFVTGDPMLGALADNGGPTQTFALLAGSPAIDAGDAATCAASPVSGLDQRGVSRPQGTTCDIGAFEALSLVVTTTADSGAGSLRAAMTAANDYPGADTITFDRTAMGCPSGACTITLSSQLPAIDDDVTITGPGAANLTISGDDTYRVMAVNAGKSLTLSGVTIADGAAVNGGGISNAGTLTVSESTFSGNSAGEFGGAIFNNLGTVTVTSSTFSGNSATYGGAIADWAFGTVSVSNSTFSGNSAVEYGGGVIANLDTVLTVSNSTFSGNSAAYTWGGGISVYYSTVHLRNTILANNSGGDCFSDSGTFATDLNNLVEDGTCSTGDASRLSGDPLLGPLADNGGPTLTFALLEGSPAIDAGDAATCAASPVNNLDQRGEPRPVGAGCDIGSVEVDLEGEESYGALTITAKNTTVTYGDAVPVYSYTAASPDGPVTFLAPPTCTSSYTPTTPVSASPLTISCTGGTTAASYSTTTYKTGKLTIQKAVLTVRPLPQSMTLGGAQPAYTYVIEGWKNGQTAATAAGFTAPACRLLNGVPTATGLYTIVCEGGSAANYTFVYEGAILTVTGAAVPTPTPPVPPTPTPGTPSWLTYVLQRLGGLGYQYAGDCSGVTGADAGEVCSTTVTRSAQGSGPEQLLTVRLYLVEAGGMLPSIHMRLEFRGSGETWVLLSESGSLTEAPTETATRPAPAPPNTGSGVDGGTSNWALVGAAMAMLAGGSLLLRRSRR